MNQKKFIVISVIIIILLGYFIYDGYHQPQGQHDVIYGNVDIREVRPAFRQTGRVEYIYVNDGDQVEKGERIAQLDPLPLQKQVALRRAQLAVAQAQLADLQAGPREQEIETAKQEVNRLTATLKNSRYNYDRYKDLRKTGATSADSLDNAQARFDETKAALAAAKQHLSLLLEGTKRQTLMIAKQQVAVAEAQLAIAQTALQDTTLYAPQKAVVLTRLVEPGTMVTATSPILSLSLREPIYIRAYIDEPMLGQIAGGERVAIHRDGTTQVVAGKIGFISPTAEFTPKTVQTAALRTNLVYRIRIIVEDNDSGLNQGQPVTISFD